MLCTDDFVIWRSVPLFPNDLCCELRRTKNIITNLPEVRDFTVVDRRQENTIFGKKILRKTNARIHHRKPIRMESTIRFRIGYELFSRGGGLQRFQYERFSILGKVIVVHEIAPRVIRRIDVDHLHLAQIRLLQQFQRIQVVTLDEQVLRRIEVHTFLATRTQGLGNRRIGSQQRLTLARPVEVIPLLRPLHDAVRQLLPKLIEVNPQLHSAILTPCFRYAVRKQLANA